MIGDEIRDNTARVVDHTFSLLFSFSFDLILNSLGTVATSVKGLIYIGPCNKYKTNKSIHN